MNKFAVRALTVDDIPYIQDYWLNASPEYLTTMGADQRKLPNRRQWQENLEKILETPEKQASTFYLVWLVDGRSIGFNSLKNIVYGERGEIHLHIWDATSRGKGYGGPLFCLAAIEFFRRFELKQIHCEPSASNPAPNRLLQRIGFPLILTHTTASSEISLVCELNRYNVTLEIAQEYLRKRLAPTAYFS
jgi:RimJ/RimL family protein N-acetyltransferase